MYQLTDTVYLKLYRLLQSKEYKSSLPIIVDWDALILRGAYENLLNSFKINLNE